MKPRTGRMPSSNASHGLRSRHWPARRRPDAAGLDPERRDPARAAVQAARRQQGVEEARAAARPRPAPPAGRPRSARGSPRGRRAGAACGGRAGSSTRPRRAVDDREPVREPSRGRSSAPAGIARRGRGRPRRAAPALLGAAALAAADRAAVVLARRGLSGVGLLRGRVVGLVGVRPARPDELVGDEHPPAGRAAGREQVADRDLQARSTGAATRTSPGTRRRGGGGPAAGGRARREVRVSGLDSRLTARRWRSIAARAIQPPRPARSGTTSPGPECASMRAATSRAAAAARADRRTEARSQARLGPGTRDRPSRKRTLRCHERPHPCRSPTRRRSPAAPIQLAPEVVAIRAAVDGAGRRLLSVPDDRLEERWLWPGSSSEVDVR